MKSVQFNFKGLMCPVFTPFADDKKRTINYDIIEKYAQYLKQKGVTAVLVNSTVGEGTTLRVEERKRIVEEWFKATRKHQLLCVVQIGGTSIADVYELAEHAEKLGVDAVITLPDLFFKPSCEEDLVHYLKDVAQYCPTRPLLYCHIPMYTKVWLSMTRFVDLAEREIPNFVGLQYVHHDLDEGIATLKQGRTIIFGMGTLMLGALVHGFEAFCITTLNMHPEMVVEIYENFRNNKLREAQTAQTKLYQRIYEIVKRGADWTLFMKNEFNKVVRDFKVDPTRKPHYNVINRQY